MWQVANNGLRPLLPAGEASEAGLAEYRALYTRCWAGEVGERPTLEEVREVLENIDTSQSAG